MSKATDIVSIPLQNGPVTDALYRATIIEFFSQIPDCPYVPTDAAIGVKAASIVEHSEMRLNNGQQVDLWDILAHSDMCEPNSAEFAPYHACALLLRHKALECYADYRANKRLFDHQPDGHVQFLALRDAAQIVGTESPTVISVVGTVAQGFTV